MKGGARGLMWGHWGQAWKALDEDWVQVLKVAKDVIRRAAKNKSKGGAPSIPPGHARASTLLLKQLGAQIGLAKAQVVYTNFLSAAIELHGMLEPGLYGEDVGRMLMSSKEGCVSVCWWEELY